MESISTIASVQPPQRLLSVPTLVVTSTTFHRDPPDPPVFPSGTRHAFTEAEFAKHGAETDTRVIISHGRVVGDARFQRLIRAEARVPLFVHETRDLSEISSALLKKILRGEFSSWAELNSGRGKIHLYLHGGNLQKSAFKTFLATLEVETASLTHCRRYYHQSYDDLATSAAADRNCFVIGLRELNPKGLRVLRVDTKPMCLDASKSYPLSMPVAILVRKGALSQQEVVEMVDRLNCLAEQSARSDFKKARAALSSGLPPENSAKLR